MGPGAKGGAAGSTTGRLDKVVVNAFCTTRCIEGGKGSWIYMDLHVASQVLVGQSQAVMVHSTKDPSLV